MEDEHTGLDLEAITKRLKSEFPSSDLPLPDAMQALLDKLEAGQTTR